MIKIHNEDECSICGNYVEYKKGYKPVIRYVFETILLTQCIPCNRLLKKIEKLKEELLNCEFELFCKKTE